MTSHKHRIAASLLIASASLFGASGIASAQPSSTVTVDGVDYPVCVEEDCSDQVGQVGVWQNSEHRSFLILGEEITIPIDPACKDICLGA